MKMNEGQCAPARWVHRWEETQRRRARAPAECMIIHASAWRLDTGPGRRLTNERIVGSSRFPWSSDNVPGFKREGSPEGRQRSPATPKPKAGPAPDGARNYLTSETGRCGGMRRDLSASSPSSCATRRQETYGFSLSEPLPVSARTCGGPDLDE
jgi:hypothetical protein